LPEVIQAIIVARDCAEIERADFSSRARTDIWSVFVMKFKGSYTALITPFKNGGLDEEAFQKFVDWQIAQGTHGLVPVGTTGESPTLTHVEHKRIG